MVLVLYPSRWQVYPQAREALIGKLKERAPYAHFQEEMFDPDLPQTTLSNFCSKRQIPCLDLTPSLREFATNNPQQPLYRDLDSHWNRLGNQQAAQAEATLLKPLIR